MTWPHISAEAFSPGEYLRDELDERGWTVSEFAEKVGRPARTVADIPGANKWVAPDTARSLSQALRTGREVRLNLETAHRFRRGALE